MLSHGVIFCVSSAKVCSPAVIETDFSYYKDKWLAVTDYYIYFYLLVLFVLVPIIQLLNFKSS